MLTAISDPIERLASLRDELQDAWVTFDRSSLEFFQTIFTRIDGADKTILEVGSGFGLTCLLFGLLGAKQVHGVELMERAVQSAQAMRESLDPALPVFFQQHNAADPLPYADNTFDALLLVEVISHVVCADFHAFMAEMARVLKPGGILYISDGNNGYSPYRRKINREIWNRFENGPPTKAGETIHSHRVHTSYLDMRREIAGRATPQLSRSEHARIAENTFCFRASQIEEAAKNYALTGELPSAGFRPGVCPVEPVNNMYIEKMFDPFELSQLLRDLKFKIKMFTTRRTLPGQRLWDALPRLTMLVSNGFVIAAEKVGTGRRLDAVHQR